MSKTQSRPSALASKDARRPQGVGLLLFDVDDTLVQAGTYISERVLKSLIAARNAGYVLSIASGRPYVMINKRILKSGAFDYALCSNGATVTRVRDAKTMCRQSMTSLEAMACHKLLAEFKPAWNAFIDGKAYFEWRGASYMLTGRTGAVSRASRYAGRGRSRLAALAKTSIRGLRFLARMTFGGGNRQVRSILPHLRDASNGVDKMGCTILNPVHCARAAELLELDGRYEVVRMGSTELEVTARGVSKGTGAHELMSLIGMAPSDAVAFGDGGNDLPLVSAVGRFVAMGNADEALKEAASDICPSVSEDGVAVWLESNILR